MSESTLLFFMTGVVLGTLLSWVIFRLKIGGFEKLADTILKQAEHEAKELGLKERYALQQNELQSRKELELHWQKEKLTLNGEEIRLRERADKIETHLQSIEKKFSEIEKREAKLASLSQALTLKEQEALKVKEKWESALEALSGTSKEEAQDKLKALYKAELKVDADRSAKLIISEAKTHAEKEAKKIIATAINRLSHGIVSEHTLSSVSIPNNEIKGRIIGREGRNIRYLEQLTGVNFIIDETPGEVILSCFNPLRREIAKTVLHDLMADGRIHPTRIEEAVVQAELKIDKLTYELGEKAATRAGVIGLDPEIIKLLGKLSFRSSFGQNVLEHSIEVSKLMGLMAGELNLNVKLAERIGLLHDMGKALTDEVPGTHAIIGYNFALKKGESLEVANGIGCHHQEMEPLTVEGSLCSAADTLSAARPGARLDALENYLQRIKALEELAYEFPGVEKSYALQAGKEIRVVVLPNMIDDLGMINLARDLTKRIEAKLDYPGKIKVTVIRETRAVEYAI